MNFIQIWDQVVQNVAKQVSNDRDKNLLLLIGSQVSIFIADNILTFQCKSQIVYTLLPEYLSAFFKEVKHITGMQNLGVSIQPAESVQPQPASQPQNQVPQPQMQQTVPLMSQTYQGGMYQQNSYQYIDPYMQIAPVAQAPQNNIIGQTVSFKEQHHLPKFMMEDRINHEKTFDNYVTDPENELICKIAKQIATAPGSSRTNPFYIYGGSGLGKTHLLFAMANEIKKNHPEKSLIYMRSEDFIKNYVGSMSSKRNDKSKNNYNYQQVYFRDFFTTQDIFIVDDIQNFIKAPGSRSAFFEIISDFLDKPNHQLVLASDVPPGKLKGFNERETSRFGSGVCREIYPPNSETRAAITISKCREFHVNLPENIIEYIATHIRSNVREIEGAIKTLSAVKMTQRELSYEDAVSSLQSLINTSNQIISLDSIKDSVVKEFNVTVEDMEGISRKRAISQARSIAMTLASDLIPSLSLNDIGRSFNKDHSSVHEAIKRTRKRLNDNHELNSVYQKLVLSLKRN